MKMLSEVTGEGRPLVLVPGGLTGWLSWIPIAERLSAARKVVRVQLLNVQLGLDGEPLPDDYSPKTEKLALANTLESLGLTPPVDFAAWSYGAEVTLDFALDNPDWIRTLTLIEPAAFWVLSALDAEAKQVLEEDRRVSREDLTEDDLERFLRRAALVPPESNPRGLPQWPLWVKHRQSLRILASVAEYQGDHGRFSGLAAPTLLVKGTGSDSLSHQVVDELGERLPKARVVELAGGHAAHLVSMEQFLKELSQLHEQAERTTRA